MLMLSRAFFLDMMQRNPEIGYYTENGDNRITGIWTSSSLRPSYHGDVVNEIPVEKSTGVKQSTIMPI